MNVRDEDDVVIDKRIEVRMGLWNGSKDRAGGSGVKTR